MMCVLLILRALGPREHSHMTLLIAESRIKTCSNQKWALWYVLVVSDSLSWGFVSIYILWNRANNTSPCTIAPRKLQRKEVLHLVDTCPFLTTTRRRLLLREAVGDCANAGLHIERVRPSSFLPVPGLGFEPGCGHLGKRKPRNIVTLPCHSRLEWPQCAGNGVTEQ